jgi:hypothetical protein
MTNGNAIQRYEELKRMALFGDPRPATDAERKELRELSPIVDELKDAFGIEKEWWKQ